MTPKLLSDIRHRDACRVVDMQDALQCDQDRSALLKYVIELEDAFRKIQQWDCLNPLVPGDYIFCDGPWLKRLVDEALTTSGVTVG